MRDFTEYPYKYFTGLEEAVSTLASTAGDLPEAAYNAVCVKECPTGPDFKKIELQFISNEDNKEGTKIYATYDS